MKLIGDQSGEDNKKQLLLPRSISVRNRNTPNRVRLVWRSKSNSGFHNLEKVLGMSKHRWKVTTQNSYDSTSIRQNESSAKDNSLNIISHQNAKTENIVKINKERVKVPSVKNLKTFFENVSYKTDKEENTFKEKIEGHHALKKMKLSNSFPILKEHTIQERDDDVKISNKKKLGNIGRTKAIEEKTFRDQRSNSFLSKPHFGKCVENIVREGDVSLGDSLTIDESLNLKESIKLKSVNDFDSINLRKSEQADFVTYCSSIDQLNEPYYPSISPQQIQNMNKNQTNIIHVSKQKESPSNAEGSVSMIKAKWENIIKESATKFSNPSSIRILHKSIYSIDDKKSDKEMENMTVVNKAFPLQSRLSLSTKQIVALFENKTAKPSVIHNVEETSHINNGTLQYSNVNNIQISQIQNDEEILVERNVEMVDLLNEYTVTADAAENSDVLERKTDFSSETDSLTDNSTHTYIVNETISENDCEKCEKSHILTPDNSNDDVADHIIKVQKLIDPLISRENVPSEFLDEKVTLLEFIRRDEECTFPCQIQESSNLTGLQEENICTADESVKDPHLLGHNLLNKSQLHSTTTHIETDGSVKSSLLREDNQLDILQRRGSKIRPLHPDEVFLFSNPTPTTFKINFQ